MDSLDVQTHVIYPTMFLIQPTARADVDLAIKRSYNRWIADRCKPANGRLRWVCLPPFSDIDAALEEIRFAKANGACAILKKGDEEDGHWVGEDYVFPIYEECQRLDLPVAFHIGAGKPDHTGSRLFEHVRFYRQGLTPINAFSSLVRFGIPARFPNVRWGFIEVGCSWLPYVVYNILRAQGRGRAEGGFQYNDPTDVVRLNKFFITCQIDEDLPYILKYAGENCLMAGSDYTHADLAQEHHFGKKLQERADQGELPQSAVDKILWDNPRAFYGL